MIRFHKRRIPIEVVILEESGATVTVEECQFGREYPSARQYCAKARETKAAPR